MPSLEVLGPDGREITRVISGSVSLMVSGIPTISLEAFGGSDFDALAIHSQPYVRVTGPDGKGKPHRVGGFRLTGQRRNRRGPGETRRNHHEGVSNVGYLLERTALGPGYATVQPDHAVRLSTPAETKTVQEILEHVLAVVQARGALPPEQFALDAAGADASIHALTMVRDDTWIDLLDELRDRRKCEWIIAAGAAGEPDVLKVRNFGELGTNRTIDPGAVVLATGQVAEDAWENKDAIQVATACVVLGANGSSVVVDLSADYLPAIGYVECTYTATDVTDTDLLTEYGTLEIRRRMHGNSGKGIRTEQNLSLPLSSSNDPVPCVHFDPGDTVVFRAEEAGEARQVDQVVLERASTGALTAKVVFDPLDSDERRYERRLARLNRLARMNAP